MPGNETQDWNQKKNVSGRNGPTRGKNSEIIQNTALSTNKKKEKINKKLIPCL